MITPQRRSSDLRPMRFDEILTSDDQAEIVEAVSKIAITLMFARLCVLKLPEFLSARATMSDAAVDKRVQGM